MRAVECKPVADYDNGLRTSSVSLEDNHEEADGNWNNVDSISLGNFKNANAKESKKERERKRKKSVLKLGK